MPLAASLFIPRILTLPTWRRWDIRLAPNAERGIFRTTDGGKTWNKVLYKDENTGGIDLSFDPTNANTIYAGLWQARRSPWGMDSGGPGSGLYRSTDGGNTWKQLPATDCRMEPWAALAWRQRTAAIVYGR